MTKKSHSYIYTREIKSMHIHSKPGMGMFVVSLFKTTPQTGKDRTVLQQVSGWADCGTPTWQNTFYQWSRLRTLTATSMTIRGIMHREGSPSRRLCVILHDILEKTKLQWAAKGSGAGKLQGNIMREILEYMGLFSVTTVNVVTQIEACIKTHRIAPQNKIYRIFV